MAKPSGLGYNRAEMLKPSQILARAEDNAAQHEPEPDDDLATDIAARGVIVAVLATFVASEQRYYLDAGFRRYAAAAAAKLTAIPALIRDGNLADVERVLANAGENDKRRTVTWLCRAESLARLCTIMPRTEAAKQLQWTDAHTRRLDRMRTLFASCTVGELDGFTALRQSGRTLMLEEAERFSGIKGAKGRTVAIAEFLESGILPLLSGGKPDETRGRKAPDALTARYPELARVRMAIRPCKPERVAVGIAGILTLLSDHRHPDSVSMWDISHYPFRCVEAAVLPDDPAAAGTIRLDFLTRAPKLGYAAISPDGQYSVPAKEEEEAANG